MIFDTHAHYDDDAFNEDRDAVLRSLAEHGIPRSAVIPKLLDQQEVAEMLGISHSNFKKLEAEGAFPFKRKMVGSAVRYRNTDVIDYIISSEV